MRSTDVPSRAWRWFPLLTFLFLTFSVGLVGTPALGAAAPPPASGPLDQVRQRLDDLHRDDLSLSNDGRTVIWNVRSQEKPSALAGILKNVMGEAITSATGVDGFNTILVEMPKPDPDAMERVIEFISQVDRPEKQVFIRVLIAEFVRGNNKDWGSHLRMLQDGIKDVTDLSMTMGLNHSPYSTVEEEKIRTGWKMFLISGGRFKEFFYAQKTANDFQILSNPQIVATHGRKAQVMVGEKVVVRQKATVQNGVAQVEYGTKAIGITLNVTPYIHSGGLVSLNIMQSATSLEKYDADLNIADTNDRQITTTVNVPVGKTVVLGGLVQRRHLDNKAGVPGLSRIPLLGKIFDRGNSEESEVELMVFLTPEVVDTGEQQDQVVSRALSSLDTANSTRKVIEDKLRKPSRETGLTGAETALAGSGTLKPMVSKASPAASETAGRPGNPSPALVGAKPAKNQSGSRKPTPVDRVTATQDRAKDQKKPVNQGL